MSLLGEGLHVKLGGAMILVDVSIEIAPGEVVAALGPNGAGKSTLLKTLSGELVPILGEARMNGRPLTAWSPIERAKRRAVLAQESTLSFPFRALDVVLMGCIPHNDGIPRRSDHATATKALQTADVEHLASRVYTTLSGGERQRVHLARALTQLWCRDCDGPAYLLLDEPTSSLDPAHQHATLGIARGCAAEGIGVLMILHDLNLAAQYADRVMLLKSGRVVREGTPAKALKPETLREVFDLDTVVMAHPSTGRPLIVPCADTGAVLRAQETQNADVSV